MAKVVACIFCAYQQKFSPASEVRFPRGFVLIKSISYRLAKGNGAGHKWENSRDLSYAVKKGIKSDPWVRFLVKECVLRLLNRRMKRKIVRTNPGTATNPFEFRVKTEQQLQSTLCGTAVVGGG